jgi:hypothetical protein
MCVIIEMNILVLRGVFGMIAFTGVFSLTAPAVTLLKTAVIAVNIRVIVQPDKRSSAPGPVDFDIKREELLSQEVCHVASPVHCCLRDAEIECSAIRPSDPGGRYRPGASGGRQRG